MKDAIIILSNRITPSRELNEESKLRIDEGLSLLDKGVARYIIMNGGLGKFTEKVNNSEYVPFGTKPVHSDLMEEYALDKGVSPNRILIQDYSYDTVGEAFFVKGMHLDPKGLADNVVVTSKYHVMRVAGIYNFILGKRFKTEFVGVPTQANDENQNILAHEIKNLNLFFEQMKDVEMGDSEGIEKALYKNHGLYSKIPKNERLTFYSSPKGL